MIKKIDHIMFNVKSLDKSLDFYEDVLGAEVVWELGNYIGLSNGIVLNDIKTPHKQAQFFEVDSVEIAVTSLKKNNVKMIMDPTSVPTGFVAAFEDPDGNIIHIIDNINLTHE